jgi:hypothetical protein
MSRVYKLPFKALGLGTGAQDLWAITSTSSMPFDLEEIRLDPCATSVSEFPITINLFTGSFTAGSGGATLTPVKLCQGDAAAVTTCKTQNTTQTAVGTGTKTNLDALSWNLVNGLIWQPSYPDHVIPVPVSACLVISLDSTPASQTVSGCAIIRERY